MHLMTDQLFRTSLQDATSSGRKHPDKEEPEIIFEGAYVTLYTGYYRT